MRAFVLVAELGSVHAAAAAIPLTQPAVTRQLQRLERTLGTTLLDRRTKPARLTAAGERALPQCRAVLAAYDALRSAARAPDAVHGVVRLGVSHALIGSAVVDATAALRERYPRVRVQLTSRASGDLLAQVTQGAVDAALVLAPTGAPVPARARELATEPLMLVAPPGTVLPPRPTLARASALGDWVVSPGDGCDVRRALEVELSRAAVPLRIAAEVQDVELQLLLIRRGAGLGIFPRRRLTRDVVRRAGVRAVPLAPRLALPVLYAVTASPGPLGPALNALGDLLRATLAR